MPANNSVIPIRAFRQGDQQNGDVNAIGELQTGEKIGIQHINTGTLATNAAFQSALANTNAYIASVAASGGEVANAYLTSTFTTNTVFQSALANTNAYIATKLDSSSYTTADVQSKAALANTNAYIATRASEADSLARLANTNSYIATKLDSSSYTTADVRSKAALANTNAYIATKVNSSNPTITGALSANGSVGTSGQVLKSAGAGNPAYWDASSGGSTTPFPFFVGGSQVNTINISDGQFPFYDNFGNADNIGAAPSGLATINNINDVTATNAVNGHVLRYNGTAWIGGFFDGLPAAIDVNASAPDDSLAIDSAGKVGIGTASPLAKLHSSVSSSGAALAGGVNVAAFLEAATNTSVQISTGTGSSAYINLGDAADIDATRLASQPGFTQLSASGASDYLRFDAGGFVERMRIDSSGNVGIGTTSPAVELEIASAQPELRLTDTDGTDQESTFVQASGTLYLNLQNDTNNGAFRVRGFASGSPTDHFLVNGSGNVGIGTSSPTSDAISKFLHINDATSAGLVLQGPRKFSVYSSSSSSLIFRDETAGATRVTLDSSGNITTTGSITPGSYRSGEIIETIACMCDGSTVSVQSGNYTITNVSAAQASTSSYVVMTGSEISYTPPAGTTRVVYRYNFKFDVTAYSGISHFKVQVDGTDVVPSSRQYSSNYASTNWHHANLELGVEWVFDCNAASDDAANGKFTSWTSAKTIRGVHRSYGGGYAHSLHSNVWWDGTGASGTRQAPIKPFLYIQAIA